MQNKTYEARHFFAGCYQVIDKATSQPVGQACRGFQGYSKGEAVLFAEAPAMVEALRMWMQEVDFGAVVNIEPVNSTRAILAQIDGEGGQ